MEAVSRRLAEAFPASNKGWSSSVEPLKNNFLSQETQTALWLLLGAVGFVLLIACANVANLLLARGTARQRELAVRASMGAAARGCSGRCSPRASTLAAIGGVLGVGLASLMLDGIMALMPPFTLPSEADVRLNIPVLLFSLAACGLAGMLFGCAPAWQAARANVNEMLKETGRSVSGGRHRLRRALVVVEFALALSLLAGGGLAIHSLMKLADVNLGFRTERLLTFDLPVAQGRLTTPEQIVGFYDRVARTRPGSAGYRLCVLLGRHARRRPQLRDAVHHRRRQARRSRRASGRRLRDGLAGVFPNVRYRDHQRPRIHG